MAGAYIFSIVIKKLSYWQELCLVILFKIDKNSKINFYYIILLFDLAVNLKIKSGEELLFDDKKIAKE